MNTFNVGDLVRNGFNGNYWPLWGQSLPDLEELVCLEHDAIALCVDLRVEEKRGEIAILLLPNGKGLGKFEVKHGVMSRI